MADPVRELARDASFIFEGTLRRTGAVTSAALKPGDEMAVVHVGRILKGPPALASFAGKEITVELRQPGASRHGGEFTFFTVGLHYGQGLAVRELGRIDARGPEVERQVHQAEQEKRDEALLERLRGAELVVAGVAVRTGPYEPPGSTPRPVSEHDADWWECLVRVRDIEKGKHPGEGKGRATAEVTILFAHSTDILWYQSPKFAEGDEGVWLLHRTDMRGNSAPGLVCDHPLDFQPLSELPRIRELLERLRR